MTFCGIPITEGSDFISFEPIGIQTKLVVNSDHAFYKNLFGSEHTTGYGKGPGTGSDVIFRAMTLTHIGQAEGGRPLFDSQVFNHLMRNWSETMENQMSRLEGHHDPDAVDFEIVMNHLKPTSHIKPHGRGAAPLHYFPMTDTLS